MLYKNFHPAPSGRPGELIISRKLATEVNLSWTPVPRRKQNGIIIGYTIKCVGPDSTLREEVLADVVSIKIPDLSPFTKYIFEVRAKTEVGTGPAANVSSETCEAGETLGI